MGDASVLAAALAAVRGAAPEALRVEIGGTLGLGPSWLLRALVLDLRGAGRHVELEGRVPEHLRFLDEIAARDVGSLPAPGEVTLADRFTALGAAGFTQNLAE